MPVFEDVTRALARQLNPGGDLTPLDSLIDFKHFCPFYLVLRKRKGTLFWGARYVRTNYTLMDLLELRSTPSDLTDCGNFRFRNMLDVELEGNMDVSMTVNVQVTVSLSQNSTLEVQIFTVAPTALENLKRKKRKLSADHPFLKEMRERKKNLYVVMEVVQAKQEVTLERTGNAKGIFSLPSLAVLGLQGSLNNNKAVTIPKECVLAYRVRQLIVNGEDEWDIPHISNDSMQTFTPRVKPRSLHISPSQTISGEMLEDFKTLKEEVQREIQEVEKLSRVGRSSLLTFLSHLLGKKEEFQDLEQELEEALDKGQEVTVEALPKDVLLSKDAMDAILYFLGALTVLSEEQLNILVKSLEKKILRVQLKLVESILEKNFLQDKEGVFPLRPDLLSSLREEELALTEALVGLGGLEVQRSGLQYTWDPNTRPHLCALYAGLSLLQLLSKDSNALTSCALS